MRQLQISLDRKTANLGLRKNKKSICSSQISRTESISSKAGAPYEKMTHK